MRGSCLGTGVLLLAAALLPAGCGRKSSVRPPTAVAGRGTTQVGVASWYGQPYAGRPAASGEIYDMDKLTAAHQTLPFGTQVKVENLDNHKSIEVRINDRGPFSRGRIIDLSRAAARALDMLGRGTARVRLEVLSIPSAIGGDLFAVQVGAFEDSGRAERLRQEMEKRYGTAKIVAREGSPILWRVLVGRVATTEAADSLARRIRKENSKVAGAAFVVRLD